MQWRCLVCGKKFTKNDKPDACPICGVEGIYIVSEAEYVKPSGKMSAVSKASFERALKLEVTATRIYNESAKKAKVEGDEVTALFFEALAKNEKGHQTAIKYQFACRRE